MNNFLKGGLAATLAASALVAAPAFAVDETEPAAVAVAYDDLDLATEEGQTQLERRLRRAARYVCGMDIRDAASRFPSREAQLCYAEKVESFDRRIASIVETQAYGG